MAFNPMIPVGNPKLFKLDSLIVSTSYGNKNEVRRSCEELLRSYDTLDCYNIPLAIPQPARVIEIYGTVPVSYKGRTYHVMVSFIFPPLFPNVPPLVHFVNPDPNRFMALQKYDTRKTIFNHNGKCYYPLNFTEVQNWMSHRSVMRVMKQLTNEFGMEYPLYEVTNKTFPPGANQPPVMGGQPGFGGMNPGFGQPQPQPGFGGGNPGFGQINQPGMGYQPKPMPNVQPTNTQQSKDALLGTVKKRYTEEALQVAKKLESDLNLQRNNMVELQNLYLKVSEEEEKLQKFEATAPKVIGDLEEKIQGLNQIITTHQGTVLNLDTLKTTIEENDPNSKQLLDLITTNKAIEDLNLLTEDLFNGGRIDLDTYLKIYKDNTEREFLNNVLMKKLITEQQPSYH